MEIGNNYYLSFKSRKHSKKYNNVDKIKNEINNTPSLKKASATVLRAYNLIEDHKGIKNAVIVPDYDSSELVYSLKAPKINSGKVKFIYTINGDKEPREAFSGFKNIKPANLG